MSHSTLSNTTDDAAPAAPLRVLLDCRMATWTGVGRYTVGLARALAARDDVALSVIVAGEGASLFPRESFDEVLMANASPFSLKGMLELGRLARLHGPDVLHCAHFPTPWPARHPLVVTLHDLTPLLIEGVMPQALRRAVYRSAVRRAVRVADLIVTPSTFTRLDVERLMPASRGKCRVTLEGADDFTSGSVVPLSEKLARLAGERYVLSMGSTRPHKDIPTLLRAFSALAPLHPELRLLLVGAGEDGYLDAHFAGSLDSVRARVAFTGRVTDDELRSLYAHAAVFAFPSRYEGFGLPPLEAMSLGAPVVVADAASLPEVVADAAVLMPPGDAPALADAIERIIGDTDTRNRLIAAGRARAAQLTWTAAGEATARVYREVVAATTGATPKPGPRR